MFSPECPPFAEHFKVMDDWQVLREENNYEFFLSKSSSFANAGDCERRRWFAFKSDKGDLQHFIDSLLMTVGDDLYQCTCGSEPHLLSKARKDARHGYRGPQFFVDRHLRHFGWTVYAPCRHGCRLYRSVTFNDQTGGQVVRPCHKALSLLHQCQNKFERSRRFEVINLHSKLYIRSTLLSRERVASQLNRSAQLFPLLN